MDRGARLRVHLAIALVLAIGFAVLAPGVAGARDPRVERRGRCDGPSHWKLEVRRETRTRLEIRFDVEGGKSGQRWNVFLSDNGSLIFSGRRISSSNGHIEVRTSTANRSGDDRISAAARNAATGERCSGRATL